MAEVIIKIHALIISANGHLRGQAFPPGTIDKYSGLTRNEKSVVKKIQYLTEFQDKGSVQVKRKSPGPHFTGSIGNLMESFITSWQESGFSASTLTSNRLYLHILLVFLEKKGVGLAGSITPTDVMALVESQKDTNLTTKYGYSE